MKKILILGFFKNKWSTNNEMKKSLVSMGFKTDTFDYREIAKKNIPNYQKNLIFTLIDKLLSRSRNILLLNKLTSYFYYQILGRKQMHKKLMLKITKNKFDLIIICKGDTISPKFIKEINTKTWYFFMDPEFIFYKVNCKEYIRASNYCSFTFSNLANVAKNYNKNSYWITQGFDNTKFYLNQNNIKNKTIDIFFAGTKNYIRRDYINFLKSKFPNLKIVCVGEGWEIRPKYDFELFDYINKSKIILNFCQSEVGFSVRVFQVLAMGGFLVSNSNKDINKLFSNSDKIVTFKNKKQLFDIIKIHLNDEPTRKKVSKNLYNYVHKNFTWNKIIDAIIKKSEI